MLTAIKEPEYHESGFPKKINRHNKDLPLNSRLRFIREKKGFTITRVVNELKRQGVPCAYSTLQSYECPEDSMHRRFPSIRMLVSLANLYECSTDFLLGITEEFHRHDDDLYNQIKNNKQVVWKKQVIDQYQANMIIYKMDQIMDL